MENFWYCFSPGHTSSSCCCFLRSCFSPTTGKPENLHIEQTAERIERGKYLANNVATCMECHSNRDWSLYAEPIKNGDFGGGFICFASFKRRQMNLLPG